MNYLNKAIIWAEIVLHKEVDWRTLAGRNVTNLNRKDAMIDTNWTRPSNCMPEWSNRGQFGFPPIVLKDVEDDSFDDDEVNDAPTLVAFGEWHERRDEHKDIEYMQQMREAMQRSLEDSGRPHRTTQYGGSSQEGSQPYLGSYGHRRGFDYGTSNRGGSQDTSAIVPPTFGGPYYKNYRQEGVPSGYRYNDGRRAYGGLATIYPNQKDDSNSDSE